MRDRRGKRTLAAVTMSIAVLENVVLICYATGGIIDDQRSGTDMPFGIAFGLIFYLVIAISMASAWVLFSKLRAGLDTVHERLLWTGMAMAIAPWTAAFSFLPAFWLGPAAMLLAVFLGATAPYVLIEAMLRVSLLRRK